MKFRRTLPSKMKRHEVADSRCRRCGRWPDQGNHETKVPPGAEWWHLYSDNGHAVASLCPVCAGAVGADLLLEADWRTIRQRWPARGRRVPNPVPA